MRILQSLKGCFIVCCQGSPPTFTQVLNCLLITPSFLYFLSRASVELSNCHPMPLSHSNYFLCFSQMPSIFPSTSKASQFTTTESYNNCTTTLCKELSAFQLLAVRGASELAQQRVIQLQNCISSPAFSDHSACNRNTFLFLLEADSETSLKHLTTVGRRCP